MLILVLFPMKRRTKTHAKHINIVLTYETEFVLCFSGTGQFCLAHGLGQFTRDVQSDVIFLNFRSDVSFAAPRKTSNDVRRRKCHK